MVVVLWKTHARMPPGETAEWPSAWPHRTLVEYSSPRQAWRVAVVEMKEVTLWSELCKSGETGLLKVRSAADGMEFAQRIFETGLSVEPA